MILTHLEKYSITASSGTVSKTIYTGQGNICYEIFVQAATLSTTFDVTLTDIYGNITFERLNNTGQLSEMLQKITYGNWTLTISNASTDESFMVLLTFREN